MTIYVDQFPSSGWGRWQGGGHLMTSDIEELHAFAERLGLKRSWFQLKTVPHYDLVRNKRDLAIRLGAVVLEFGQFPDDQLWSCRDGGFETTLERRARLPRL